MKLWAFNFTAALSLLTMFSIGALWFAGKRGGSGRIYIGNGQVVAEAAAIDSAFLLRLNFYDYPIRQTSPDLPFVRFRDVGWFLGDSREWAYGRSGFEAGYFVADYGRRRTTFLRSWTIACPLWFALLVGATPPAVWIYGRVRRRDKNRFRGFFPNLPQPPS